MNPFTSTTWTSRLLQSKPALRVYRSTIGVRTMRLITACTILLCISTLSRLGYVSSALERFKFGCSVWCVLLSRRVWCLRWCEHCLDELWRFELGRGSPLSFFL